MPQLMPLNWIFSSMMMFLVSISAMLLFSNEMNMINIKGEVSNKIKENKYWCW